MKKFGVIFSLFIASLFFVACENEQNSIDAIDDNSSISAIQTASKKTINVDALPSLSQTILSEEYSEDYVELAQFAEGLGYLVKVRRSQGALAGEQTEVFFNMAGLKLGHLFNGKLNSEIGHHANCFTLLLPISFVMPDESEIVIESTDDYSLIKAWYEENNTVSEKPSLVYPVSVSLADGTETSINDTEEMQSLIETCLPTATPCFEFVYPITFIMPDETEIVVNSLEEMQAVKDWHDANPDVEERGSIVFPIEITIDDETQTINSEDELKSIHNACRGNHHGHNKHDGNNHQESCFELVFPVTHIMPDGSSITSESYEEMHDALHTWHEENPEATERGELQFPINVVLADGTNQTVNSAEEMESLTADCPQAKNRGKDRRGDKRR